MKTGLELSDDDVVPLDAIAPGVVGLRIVFVNVFAIADDGGWVLVDAGLRGSAGRIRAWAQQHFGDAPPRAVVLTHGHFDHVGALPALLDHWDVPVFASERELPFLQGRRRYPPPNPRASRGLMARLSALYPRGPLQLGHRARALPSNGTIDVLPGWRWLHTPGHTAGHISLFRDADRTLVVGDAFCTTRAESAFDSITQRPELHGPPAYFTEDWMTARASVATLAALEPRVVAPGHGQPMHGDHLVEALRTLASEFEERAMPDPARLDGRLLPRPISPGAHAVLDYAVALTFLLAAWRLSRTAPRAANLAYLNAGMVLGLSLLTDYPGGAYRTLSFNTHRRGDLVQMALAALGPRLMGFGHTPAASFFAGQALSEAAVIAMTDWDAGDRANGRLRRVA